MISNLGNNFTYSLSYNQFQYDNTRMTTFIKTKFKKTNDQTNIDKCRVVTNITQYHVISKLIFLRITCYVKQDFLKSMKLRQLGTRQRFSQIPPIYQNSLGKRGIIQRGFRGQRQSEQCIQEKEKGFYSQDKAQDGFDPEEISKNSGRKGKIYTRAILLRNKF